MSKRLFVGGLAWGTTEDSLRDLFSEIGNVEDLIIMKDRDSGRSRGFGFVTMSNDDESKTAIEQIDGKDFEGRTIHVNEARERN